MGVLLVDLISGMITRFEAFVKFQQRHQQDLRKIRHSVYYGGRTCRRKCELAPLYIAQTDSLCYSA